MMNHPEAFRKCHWNAEEREYRFSTAEDGAILASASLELQFDDRSCEEELMAEESGDVHMENAFAEAAICNEVNQEYDILRQTVRIQARRNGVLRGRYTITLRGTSGMEVYLPMHWGYLGKASDMPDVDTTYPHYTWMEGYKNQLRTPVLCAWCGGYCFTVAALGPYPAHILMEKLCGGVRFVLVADRPRIGPDICESSPEMAPGEELSLQVYLDLRKGDWRSGVKHWMRYFLSAVAKDDAPPPEWTKHVRMFWCKWDKIGKSDIDEMAALGVELLEVHPFTEPEPDIIAYAHEKGLRILLEHYLLSFYEPVRQDRLNLADGMDDPQILKASLAMAERHPDWCALDHDGKRFGGSSEGGSYVHMDPNVEAFRRAKVEEAVEAVKRGYDGIRYDNALVLECHSTLHEHTMTYAHAVSLMLREIRDAVRKVNPQAVVFINNAGPDLYSVADLHMYESGLSSESFFYEQAGRGKLKASSYAGAHNRLLTAKVLWEFAGKRYCVHDYPVNTGKGIGAAWRSAIFTLMHDGICSFGGAIENVEGSRLPEYRIASELLTGLGHPLGEIVSSGNLAYRVYDSGTILVLETKGIKGTGTVSCGALPLRETAGYELSSRISHALLRRLSASELRNGIPLELMPDGYEVLQIGTPE